MLVLRSVESASDWSWFAELFSVIDGRDWDRLRAFFDPAIVYHRPGFDPIRGLSDLLAFYDHVRDVDEGTHHLEGFVCQNGQAVCWGRFTARTRSGRPIDERFSDIYELRDSKIVTRRTYFFRPAI